MASDEEDCVPAAAADPLRSERGGGGDHELIFRVVAHGGRKHGFRLEAIFWRILQLAATADQKRVGAYVEKVLERHDGGANLSSVLRTHAAEWLSGRLAEATSRALSPRTLGKLVQAAPLPCFAMSSDNKIVTQNQLFLELLKGLLAEAALVSSDAVHIRFETDSGAIRKLLTESGHPFVDDALHIQFRTRSLHRKARIVGIDTAHGEMRGYLIFITS